MTHQYHILEWKAPDISTFLQYPGLAFAVFNFEKPMLGHYVLLVAGFDDNGNFLGTSPLEKYPDFPSPDLENAYPAGLFFVKALDLKNYSGSGTITLYFEPVAYSPGGPGTQQYVRYYIYNAPPVNDAFEETNLVTPINPSPPRNAS